MKSRLAPIWLARLILAIYLATVPLYGMTATIAAFACQSELAAGAAQEPQQYSQAPAMLHDQASLAQAADPAGFDSDDGAYNGHLCCQLVVTALPSEAAPVAPQEHSALPSSPDVFYYVTFLDRFQRPPLA